MDSDLNTLLVLGFDLASFFVLYMMYNGENKKADEIKNAPHYSLDADLLKTLSDRTPSSLAYACVNGNVIPEDKVLHSKHDKERKGVIRRIKQYGMKSSPEQGVWTDITCYFYEKVQHVPFVLRRKHNKGFWTEIHVMKPTCAPHLLGKLTTTYDYSQPNRGSNLLPQGTERVAGNQKFSETEKMLLTNTMLWGIGEISLVDNKMYLRPPQDGRMYVLTTMSRDEIVKQLADFSDKIRVLMYCTGIIGAAIVLRLVYRKWKTMLAELRQNTRCVVCLTNRKEIVLHDCNHLCLCVQCLDQNAGPLVCPVCQQPVDRYTQIR